jgi:hypothetical protein
MSGSSSVDVWLSDEYAWSGVQCLQRSEFGFWCMVSLQDMHVCVGGVSFMNQCRACLRVVFVFGLLVS